MSRYRISFERRMICICSFVLLIAMAATANAAALAPDSLAGLTAWYKADAISGLSDGDPVATWVDSGPNGYDMSQLIVEDQPTYVQSGKNGLPSVYFGGSHFFSAGDVEMHSDTNGITVLGVMQSFGSSALISKFCYSSPQRQWRLENTGFDFQELPDSWEPNNLAKIPSGKYYTQWQVVGGSWSPSLTTGYFDGLPVATADIPAMYGSDTDSEVLLGASNEGLGDPALGLMSEVVVYNRALSDVEVAGVSEYLSDKYQVVTPTVNHAPLSIDINFQPAASPAVAGYLTDSGQVFSQQGDYKYGWSQDATAQAVAAAPSEIAAGRMENADRFNTFVHMRNVDFQADWEIEVPNGTYYVRGVYGEPRSGHGSGIQRIVMEDMTLEDRTPVYGTTEVGDWDEHWGVVEVKDGRLSLGVGDVAVGDDPVTGEPIYVPGSGKLGFVQIRELTVPEIAISFQNEGAYLTAGFTRDDGHAFGDREGGLRYGWIDSTGTPVENTVNARMRGSYASVNGLLGDERFGGLNHFNDQYTPDTYYTWELELENGEYTVMAVFGEGNTGGYAGDDIWIEDELYLDADYNARMSDSDVYFGEITITDGRLTLRSDDINAKIMYLQVTTLEEGPEYIGGDANRDGTVDVSDLGILATHYGAGSDKTWAEGDFTGDGAVDVSDLGVLATNYGMSSLAAVPEPGTLVLLASLIPIGLFLRTGARRRRNSMIRLTAVLLAVSMAAATAHAAGTAPGDLSGLTAWYQAETITGLADGTPIGTWPDSGPNGYDITQATTTAQPTWSIDTLTGEAGINFTGAEYLTGGDVELHGEYGFTIVAMVQQTSNSGYSASKFNYADGRQWRMSGVGFDMQETPDSWDGGNYASGGGLTRDPSTVIGRWDAGMVSELRFNNVVAGSATGPAFSTTDTAAIFTIGADRGGTAARFAGIMHEVAFFDRALSEVELGEIQAYYDDKYDYTPLVEPDPTQPSLVANVNFQPAASSPTLPSYYVADTGQTFQAHGDLSYGWSQDMSAYARSTAPEQMTDPRDFTNERFDTVINTSAAGTPANWEMEVPNGTYWVRALFGEPRVGFVRGDLTANIESTRFNDTLASMNVTTKSAWAENWGLVEVEDGRLTVESAAQFQIGQNASSEPVFMQTTSNLALVQVHEANVPDIAVNFQRTSDGDVFASEEDGGEAYGLRDNGLTYGWLDKTGTPVSNTSMARNRGTTVAPMGFDPSDVRFATLNHMLDKRWEIEVENGTYSFILVCGEPVGGGNYSLNFLDIEGVRYDDPDYPDPRSNFDVFMGQVEVADGRFTIDGVADELAAFGGTPDNKVVYLELTHLLGPAATTIPEPATASMLLALAMGLALIGKRRR